jgi:hypothetical protein
VATTAKRCEEIALKNIRETARDAWWNDDGSTYRRLRDALNDIHWSGVCAFDLGDLLRKADDRESDAATGALNDNGFWFPDLP